jgi:hypothetical protein
VDVVPAMGPAVSPPARCASVVRQKQPPPCVDTVIALLGAEAFPARSTATIGDCERAGELVVGDCVRVAA